MGTKNNPRPKKSGGLYIRRKSEWNEVKNVFEEVDYYQATAEIHDASRPGKRIRITGTAKSPEEARRRLEKSRERYYEKRSGEKLGVVVKKRTRSGLTVESYIEQWASTLNKSKVSPNMRRVYLRTLQMHVIPYVGNIYLTELNKEHLQHLFVDILPNKLKDPENPAEGILLSTNSQLNVYKYLRTALISAVDDKLISVNPLKKVDTPKYVQPPENIGHILHVSLGMFSAMDKANDPAHAHFILALYGLRRAERLGLKFSDLKLTAEHPSMTITHQLSRERGRGLFVKGETKTGVPRTVNLIEPFLSSLKEMKAYRKKQLKMPGFKPTKEFEDLVFLRDDGKPWDLNQDNTWWAKVNEKYNPHTPPIRGHALRHVSATYLAERGVSEDVVRAILGHETVAMGYYYARVTLKKQRIEADKFEDDLIRLTSARNKPA